MALSYMVRRANNAFGPVEAAVDTFGDDVSAELTKLTNPHVPEGGTNTDYRQMMTSHVSVAKTAPVEASSRVAVRVGMNRFGMRDLLVGLPEDRATARRAHTLPCMWAMV